MGPKPSSPDSGDLFISRLDELINMKHPLVRMAELIDWGEIERSFSASFTSARGRPALSPRLVAGLLYLQHTFDASDEAVVNTWVENPYWQFFCGETYLQTEAPIDPSSLTRWRKRIGEEGVETLLMSTIEAARRGGVIKKASVDRVIVDTTVMPKAIAYPTDGRLLERIRQHLVKAADAHGLRLRQNDNRIAPRLAAQSGATPTPSSSSACAVLCARCARGWGACTARWPANCICCPRRRAPRSRTCCSARAVSWANAPRTRTSSTRCTHPRWSASARAKPGHPTNSASRSASPPR